MISLVVIALMTAAYLVLGWRGMSKLRDERKSLKLPKKPPMVSIVIPAFRSEKRIHETLKSARDIDYPNKEIIVVNDSMDKTPEIARRFGARVLQNKKRMGKPFGLNRATRAARGEYIFVLDSDTVANKDVLKKMVPWLSRDRVAAVMPKYLLKNDGWLSRLAEADGFFMYALLKVHLAFGSILGFRGCNVLLRKDVLMKHPWPDVLIEDNYLAADLNKEGYRVIWEPEAITHTEEPNDFKSLREQRKRWGEGVYFTIQCHKHFYVKTPQFMLFFYPYVILGIATSILLMVLLLSPMFFPTLTGPLISELVWIFIAMYVHTVIFLKSGSERFMPLRAFLLMTAYYPVIAYSYSQGILRGFRRRKQGCKLNLKSWDHVT